VRSRVRKHAEPTLKSRAMKHQNEQQKLKALVRDLERELAQGKSQVEALEETHERLRQTEQICQELSDENRRLREQVTDWQKRFAANEENEREIVSLRQQLDALQSEYTRAMDSNHQTQANFSGDSEAEARSWPVQDDAVENKVPQSHTNTVAGSTSDLSGSGEKNDQLLTAADSIAKIGLAKNPRQIVWTLIAQNWHLGAIFAGVIILIVATVVSLKMLRSEAPTSSSPIPLPAETANFEQPKSSVSTPPVVATPRVKGTFRTVRPTQVFSGPSEDSALIANIDKGIKLNVVDSTGGWLEVRSKHGRPPGFIRQEATVRINPN
jgi:hypothetical protein